MSTRDDAWRSVHDPATSAEQLAGIASQYPEFGDAIARHPNSYPALREWIATNTTLAELPEVAPDADGPPRSGKRQHRLILGGAAVALVALIGGGAWAVIAGTSSSNDDRRADAPLITTAPAEVPGERVLDGPPVYVGDELGWLIFDETEVSAYFSGGQNFSSGSTVFTVGESEGVHTVPDTCWPWLFRDEGAVVGVRSLVWQSSEIGQDGGGWFSARQFPDAAYATTQFDSYVDSVGACGDYNVNQYDVDVISENTLAVTAQSADGFVVEQRSVLLGTGAVSVQTRAVVLEGNVIITLDATHAEDTLPDGPALLAALENRVDQAHDQLTEKIGYR